MFGRLFNKFSGGRTIQAIKAVDRALGFVERPLPDRTFRDLLGGLGLDTGKSPNDMAAQLSEYIRGDPNTYLRNFDQSIKKVVPFLNDAYLTGRRNDPVSAGRMVFTQALDGVDSGHARIVITQEPLVDTSMVGKLDLMKNVTAGFPGMFSVLTDAVRANPTPETMRAAQRDLMLDPSKSLADHVFRIGYSSVIVGRMHYAGEVDGNTHQVFLAETTKEHAFAGIVPWQAFTDGETTYYVSIHLGESVVYFADTLNDLVAPCLFKIVFRTGTEYINFRPTLLERFGPEATAEGPLNPEVNAAFNEHLATIDSRIYIDQIVLAGADLVGGNVLAKLNVLAPSNAALPDMESTVRVLGSQTVEEYDANLAATQLEDIRYLTASDVQPGDGVTATTPGEASGDGGPSLDPADPLEPEGGDPLHDPDDPFSSGEGPELDPIDHGGPSEPPGGPPEIGPGSGEGPMGDPNPFE